MSFTEDQIDEFQEVFRLFDTKGDGMIPVIITKLARLFVIIFFAQLRPFCLEMQKHKLALLNWHLKMSLETSVQIMQYKLRTSNVKTSWGK